MTIYSNPGMGFAGFPTGKNPYVPIPEAFFTQLLPEIEDSTELKVTLHIFYLLAQQRGNPRCTSDRDLMNDQLLLHSLKRRGDPRPVQERLRLGLEQAVARGTLLKIQLRVVRETEEESVGWYFFNTARSRKAVLELQGGEMIPAHLLNKDAALPETEEEEQLAIAGNRYATSRGYIAEQMHIEIERPNIFTLYEQNIGLLTPLLADELKDAAEHYPHEWIEAALKEAVEQNKRKWSYIRAILRRWETEGRQ